MENGNLVIDSENNSDNVIIIDDIDVLCRAKDVIGENYSKKEPILYEVFLYCNDNIRKYFQVYRGSKINFGSLEKYLN